MKNDLLPTIVNIPDDIEKLYFYHEAYVTLFDEDIKIIKVGYDKYSSINYFLIYTDKFRFNGVRKNNIALKVEQISKYHEKDVYTIISGEHHSISIKEIGCINDYTKSNLSFKFYPKIEEALKPHLTKIRMME